MNTHKSYGRVTARPPTPKEQTVTKFVQTTSNASRLVPPADPKSRAQQFRERDAKTGGVPGDRPFDPKPSTPDDPPSAAQRADPARSSAASRRRITGS